jgi:tol-pal system-associated acyl-CoA thioesterase
MQPFTSCYRVYYEDTDAGGVVYYANYLKFCERARSDYLRSLRLEQSQLTAQYNIIFVVSSCTIDYKLPARLDDEIVVNTDISQLGNTYIDFNHEIVQKNNHKVLTSSQVRVVCIHASSMRPVAIPRAVSDKLLD